MSEPPPFFLLFFNPAPILSDQGVPVYLLAQYHSPVPFCSRRNTSGSSTKPTRIYPHIGFNQATWYNQYPPYKAAPSPTPNPSTKYKRDEFSSFLYFIFAP
jgi:hypothetical protein